MRRFSIPVETSFFNLDTSDFHLTGTLTGTT
jgi:hypothetical protein